MPHAANRKTLWVTTRRITLGLLLAWLLATLAVPWFARDLGGMRAFGLPLPWWLASQGVLLLYLALIVVYVVVMDRAEARYLRTLREIDATAALSAHDSSVVTAAP